MDKKRQHTNVWDIVATKFSKVGPSYWNVFGEHLVELSNIKDGGVVLDIGMGRGASLFPATKKVGSDGRVIGIDLSGKMVHETKVELLEKSIENAKVYMMDVKNIRFDEETFDYIISGFFITYLFHSEQKLNNISKMLKKGGKLSFSTWGEQIDQKWLTLIVDKYIDKNTSSTGIKYNTVESIINMLKESGFHNIRVHEEQPHVIYRNSDEWWDEMNSNAFRGIIEEIAKMGMSQLDSFKIDVYEGLKEFRREDGIYIKMSVIYAFCEK
ncbi:class I SAM-dependent methyltransferase [Vallitalea sp.]|jgi:ubiquinone/menaquinone biosynthesis C-methylase UbiE|uniref:class I SAM-dependent methyltransferase n=1 Tax=Vallitalea sp. TaxID=1882829 RepID=UPI0025CC2D16|nr:class I SAM-dependent methyltransferase [Vallitalea sp.]MCT4687016.1 methyltransferase domain-containing protein [Vallitalea sp.]